MLRFLSIVLLCMVAAVFYGLIHDQITVRICREYFTILHPQILPDDTSSTVVALVWGVIATWWVGLVLGFMLAVTSCVGDRPQLSPLSLIKPILCLLLIMASGATMAGLTGYLLASHGVAIFSQDIVDSLPPNAVVGAVTDWFTHLASYALGFVGGIGLAIWAWIKRGKLLVGVSR